jgi:hypothetical protein
MAHLYNTTKKDTAFEWLQAQLLSPKPLPSLFNAANIIEKERSKEGMATENSRSPTVSVETSKPEATFMEDSHQVAFMVLKGHKIKLWRDTEDASHIQFEILCTPDQADTEMAKYFANEQVGITDYINCLKSVKSQMYSMKKMIKQ